MGMRGIDQSVGMMLITLAFLFISWTLAVVVMTVILPHVFHLEVPWAIVVLAWVAPGLPYLSKQRRS